MERTVAMESTQESTGVMHKVGELLAAGKSSREVIDMGYAPGSVYKVQRRIRKTAVMVQPKTEGSPQATTTIEQTPIMQIDVNALIGKLLDCREESQRLKSELESLRDIKAEKNNSIDLLKKEVNGQQQKLQISEKENADLKRYLSSRNCGWEKDFKMYQEHLLFHRGTYLPMCSGPVKTTIKT
jgi:hypothetical protein